MYDCLLLGRDHDECGIATTVAVGDRAAASISVGGDPRSPSLQFKGSRYVPNEDALCIVDSGDRVVMAVADAHFGHEASHAMIDWLHASFTKTMPANAHSGGRRFGQSARPGNGFGVDTCRRSIRSSRWPWIGRQLRRLQFGGGDRCRGVPPGEPQGRTLRGYWRPVAGWELLV